MWRSALQRFRYSTSASTSLPKLYKFGGMQLDLNNMLAEFPVLKQNVQSRKAKVDLDKLLALYHRYSDLRKEIGILTRRCRDHEDMYGFICEIGRKTDVEEIQQDRRRKKMAKRYNDVGRGYQDELKEDEQLVGKVEKEFIVSFSL